MSTEDTTRDGGRDVAPVDQQQPERRQEPSPQAPSTISDADRAANPFGTARRERDRQRDDGGRFAKPDGKDAPEAPEGGKKPPEGQQQDRQQQPGHVPGSALAAERDKRQAAEGKLERLEREMAEMRGVMQGMGRQQGAPQQQSQAEAPPEFWADPQARVAHEVRQAMSPVQQALEQQRIYMSRAMATQVHGPEKVDAAIRALTELAQVNRAEFQRLETQAAQSIDPIGDVVRWHMNTTALREIGNDPAAFRERVRQELLAEMQQGDDVQNQLAPPSTRRPPQPQLPSSFAGMPGGGPRGGSGGGGARTIQELLGR